MKDTKLNQSTKKVINKINIQIKIGMKEEDPFGHTYNEEKKRKTTYLYDKGRRNATKE